VNLYISEASRFGDLFAFSWNFQKIICNFGFAELTLHSEEKENAIFFVLLSFFRNFAA